MRGSAIVVVVLLVSCTRTEPTRTTVEPVDATPSLGSAVPLAAKTCGAQEELHYTAKGCNGASTTCQKPFECAASSVFCGCDGKPFHDCSPPTRPYAHEGPCPTKEGSPCASGSECTSGFCVFEAGCTPPKGKCTGGPIPPCTVAHPYCGCALGKTYNACLPTLPFSRAGVCP